MGTQEKSVSQLTEEDGRRCSYAGTPGHNNDDSYSIIIGDLIGSVTGFNDESVRSYDEWS